MAAIIFGIPNINQFLLVFYAQTYIQNYAQTYTYKYSHLLLFTYHLRLSSFTCPFSFHLYQFVSLFTVLIPVISVFFY